MIITPITATISQRGRRGKAVNYAASGAKSRGQDRNSDPQTAVGGKPTAGRVVQPQLQAPVVTNPHLC